MATNHLPQVSIKIIVSISVYFVMKIEGADIILSRVVVLESNHKRQ